MDIKKSLAAQAYAQTRSAAPPAGLPNSAEEDAARSAGFEPIGLGPRVLRAETAPLAALAALTLL